MKFQPIGSLKDELGQRIPGCYRATFKVNKPSDTFLNFETWGKGLVYVNGTPWDAFGKSTATDPLHPGMLVEER